MNVLAISTLDNCPACNGKFIYDKGELVCPKDGLVPPSFNPYVGAEQYGRGPQSHLMYGGGLGTDIYSTKRGPDGESSASFETKGDNGKYKPITYVLQPWDLLTVVEPESKDRAMKERISSKAVRMRIVNELPCPKCDRSFGDPREYSLHLAVHRKWTVVEELEQELIELGLPTIRFDDYVAVTSRANPAASGSRSLRRRRKKLNEVEISNAGRPI